MTDAKNEAAGGASASNAGLCVGGKVKLLKSIFDCGEDHHPPGQLAKRGEVLTIKAVDGDTLAVAHEGNPGAFSVYPGEYEAHNAKLSRGETQNAKTNTA